MKKVYVVTEGCYSEYHIVAIFSTKEKAKEYIEFCGTNYTNDIEEYAIDTLIERKDRLYNVIVDPNEIYVQDIVELDDYTSVKEDEFKVAYDDCIELTIKTDSLEKARRIAADRYTQIKALQDIAFPNMYKKYPSVIGEDYPYYNFITKEMRLPLE